uniref:Protein arginine methyltransferase NDUFAF7 n=1 Tax=Palpitomonas bilix TaxID=652834 RepID=A0A7S3G7S8_9EUKA
MATLPLIKRAVATIPRPSCLLFSSHLSRLSHRGGLHASATYSTASKSGGSSERGKEGEGGGEREVKISTAGLETVSTSYFDSLPDEHKKEFETPTPLAEELLDRIKVDGPITVADYMRAALAHPRHGYYMKRDVFGKQGDFITSPEVSPMFGEMIGVWGVNAYKMSGSPSRMRVVEIGAGRGTLSEDILRTVGQFADTSTSISMHIVDISPALRSIQSKRLTGKEEVKIGEQTRTKSGVPITWHTDFSDVPDDGPIFVVCQELFDAMPIHQFEKVNGKWYERLVDDSVHAADQALIRGVQLDEDTAFPKGLDGKKTLFNFVRANTPFVNALLPRIRVRPEQTFVEVSPESWQLAGDIGKRIDKKGGAALFIDYGRDATPALTLRGIRSHKHVHPLEKPGETDVSAYVDFAALKSFANVGTAKAVGSVSQRDFLLELGMNFRLDALIAANPSMKEELQFGYDRLVGTDVADFGTTFRVLSVTPASWGTPPGFTAAVHGKAMEWGA